MQQDVVTGIALVDLQKSQSLKAQPRCNPGRYERHRNRQATA